MSILSYLNGITTNSFWMYVSAALALMLVGGKLVAAIAKTLKISIDFLRSEQLAWMVEKGRKLTASISRDFTKTVSYARPKAGRKIKLNGAIGNSILYYLFSGLLFLAWLGLLASAAINLNHLKGWILIVLAAATVTIVPAALYFAGLAIKEQATAKRIWQQCRAEGLRAYMALVATPTTLIGLALIITALQQWGGT
ncbi:hypothetical protein [Variovorax sp. DAIF25]|jgi:hypothetical protein|uniref:hypothetical protein n=1 Tax=Variovorax sp. DAIF25 TaxID=3080983 RepID=UPI003D6AD812